MPDILTTIWTAICSLVVLFLLTKLMGNKQVSQLSMFDYIVGISIGSIAAEFATELDKPLYPLISMILYGLIATGISFLTSKSIRARRLISGRPTVLMSAGALYRDRLKSARFDLGDLLMLARAAGYFNLADVEAAILEENGTVSFLPKEGARPATPGDLNLFPPQKRVPAVLVEDGEVIVENLAVLGLDGEWLRKELKSRGYSGAEQVFFAAVDENRVLTAFGMNPKQNPPPV